MVERGPANYPAARFHRRTLLWFEFFFFSNGTRISTHWSLTRLKLHLLVLPLVQLEAKAADKCNPRSWNGLHATLNLLQPANYRTPTNPWNKMSLINLVKSEQATLSNTPRLPLKATHSQNLRVPVWFYLGISIYFDRLHRNAKMRNEKGECCSICRFSSLVLKKGPFLELIDLSWSTEESLTCNANDRICGERKTMGSVTKL